MNSRYNALKDLCLAKKIRSAIRWDKRVSTLDIKVFVDCGEVTLQGSVDNQTKKKAFSEIVMNIQGVLSVDDEIVVEPRFSRSDSEIKKMLLAQIAKLNLSGGEHIHVSVQNGRVKLEGVVNSKASKAGAAGYAWELSGVEDCANLISISRPRMGAKDSVRPMRHVEWPMRYASSMNH